MNHYVNHSPFPLEESHISEVHEIHPRLPETWWRERARSVLLLLYVERTPWWRKVERGIGKVVDRMNLQVKHASHVKIPASAESTKYEGDNTE